MAVYGTTALKPSLHTIACEVENHLADIPFSHPLKSPTGLQFS